MIGLMTLVVVGFAVLLLLAGAFALFAFVKAILWIVLLPFRLLFGLVFGVVLIPLLVLKLLFIVIGAVLLVALAPVVLIGVIGAVIATLMGVAVPLFPLICIGFVVWAVTRPRRASVDLQSTR